jgi:hypothetical protein
MKQADTVIKLNVGGKRFETLRSTLLSVEGTYFSGLLEYHARDNDYFIDRDGELFGPILNYLRGKRDEYINPIEAAYYCLPLASMPFHQAVQKGIHHRNCSISAHSLIAPLRDVVSHDFFVGLFTL